MTDFIIELVDYADTSLEPYHTWVNYRCIDPATGVCLLDSWDIVPTNASSSEVRAFIREDIANRGGIERFPRLSDLHPTLKYWIESCHYSENEMFFIDYDDYEEEMANNNVKDIWESVKKWNLERYVEIFEKEDYKDDGEPLVTVFGGVSCAVNWLD